MARQYMIDYRGEHASLANGKMYDFKLIRIALERWGERVLSAKTLPEVLDELS